MECKESSRMRVREAHHGEEEHGEDEYEGPSGHDVVATVAFVAVHLDAP